MTLLSYLVPALRDVRAPLIGGYLWLLLGWLWMSHLVPSQAELEPGSVFATLSRLQDVAGSAGLVVALSVAAYLVGSFVSEFVDLILGWLPFGIHPDLLKGVVAAIPEFEHATDTAQRLYAEGQLRFHVALPLAGIALTVAGGEDIMAVIVLSLFAAAMLCQGILLLMRAAKVARGVERAVLERQAEMSEGARRQQKADVRVRPSGKERLAIHNRGPETAHELDITSSDGHRPTFLIGDLLPIRELRPDDTVELPIALSIGDAPAIDVTVSWVDPSGRQERMQRLHWL